MQTLLLLLAVASGDEGEITAEYRRILGCSSVDAEKVRRSGFRAVATDTDDAYGADFVVRGCGPEFIVSWSRVKFKGGMGGVPAMFAYFDDREVRARAPLELDCKDVEVSWLGNRSRLAKGCGRAITYVFQGTLMEGGSWSADFVHPASGGKSSASAKPAPPPRATAARAKSPPPVATPFATDSSPVATLQLVGPKGYPFASEYGEDFGRLSLPLGTEARVVTIRRNAYSDTSWSVRAWVDEKHLVVDDGKNPPQRVELRGRTRFECSWSPGRGVEDLEPG